jgi:hypothetical protein
MVDDNRNYRRQFAALGATPDRRGMKRGKAAQAKTVLDSDADWGDLLN